MAIQLSTGMRNQMLDTADVGTILDLGFIKIYGGTPPASPDDAESGVLLATISVNSTGTGLTFEAAAVSGTLAKNSAEIWSGLVLATGTATHYRHIGAADDGTTSTTQPRVQGTIATAAADMNLTDTSLTLNATQTIDYYVLTMPAS